MNCATQSDKTQARGAAEGAVSDEAIKCLEIRSPLNCAIYGVVRNYRLSNVRDDDGCSYPLVDLMSNEPPADIGTGEMEMVALVDEIESAVIAASPLRNPEALEKAAEQYAYNPSSPRLANSRDSWVDPEAAFIAGAQWRAFSAAPQWEVMDERGHWFPKPGTEVRVSEQCSCHGDWQHERLWVAGYKMEPGKDGLNVMVSHEWPLKHGLTDDFWINRPLRSDDLEPVAGFAPQPSVSSADRGK